MKLFTKLTKRFHVRTAVTLLLAMYTFATVLAQDQTNITLEIGDPESSASGHQLPVNMYYNSTLTQQIFTAEEIGAAGVIYSISFEYLHTSQFSLDGIQVYMKTVGDKTAFDSNTDMVSVSATDKVWEGTFSATEAGWITINLDTPFQYDGTENLLVCFYDPVVDNYLGSSYKFRVTSTTGNTSISYYDDSYVPELDNLSSYSKNRSRYNYRNNIRLGIVAGDFVAIPASLEATEIKAREATLSWSGGTGTYNVEYKKATDDNWISALTNTTETSFNLTSLTPDTKYQVRVQSVDDEKVSAWKKTDFTTLISCPAPTDFAATLATANSTEATLSWTENGSATSWEICLNDDETSLITTTDNPYTLTGLTLETVYTAKVRAVNSDSDKSRWSDAVTIEPTEKLVVGTGTGSYAYLPLITFYKYGLTQQIYTVEELGEAGLINSIDFKNVSSSDCTRNIDIYMVSTDKSTFSDGSDWISATAADLVFSGEVTFAAGSWTEIVLDNPFNYDALSNVAIIVDDNTGADITPTNFLTYETGSNSSLSIRNDNTNFDPANMGSYNGTLVQSKNIIRILKSGNANVVTCPRPTNFAVSELTPESVTLSWTENGSATSWEICLNDDGTSLVTADTNPYTVTGLTPEVVYTAKLRAVNSDSDKSVWSGAVTFVPTDKQLIGSGTGFSSNQPLSNLYRYSLTQQIYTAEELGEAGFINSIDFKSVSNADCTRNIDIYMVSTDKTTFSGANDWISATAGDLVFSGEVTFAAGSWTEIVLDNSFNYDAQSNVAIIVDDNTGTDISTRNFLTYKTESNSSLYIHSDGTNYDPASPGSYNGTLVQSKNIIRILKSSNGTVMTCPRPTNFAVSEMTSESVTLSWTENGSATSWEICLNDDETSIITADTNPYTLTGLTPEAVYTAKVRAVNSDSDKSRWTGAVTFEPSNKQVIGSGTGSISYLPLYSWYNYSLSQQIYTEEELGEAGLIHSIDFMNAGSNDYSRNIDIYMVNTDKTTFRDSVDWISATAADLVFSGEVTFAAGSWTGIELDNPFDYDGLSNVAIIVDDNTGSYVSSINFLAQKTENNSSLYAYNDNTNYDPASPGSYKGYRPEYKNVIRILKTATNSPYLRPSNFVASEIGSANVKLSWTDNCTPAAQEWVIAYKAASDEDFSEVTTTENPFLLTELTPETEYTVKVRPVVADETIIKWSCAITFSTKESHSAPTNIAFDNVNGNSATVTWTGNNEVTSYNLRYRKKSVAPMAIVTLTADAIWSDGTGYQMLIDADSTAYGTIIPAEAWLTSSNDASDETYAEFEYKIPEDADGSLYTTHMLRDSTATIEIPAGTYDWCITNPTPNDRMWIASGNGTVGGRADNYVFEAGKKYEFHVYMSATGEAVDVTVTDALGEENSTEEWTVVNGVTSPYTIEGLDAKSYYMVEVQAVYADGESQWNGYYFKTTAQNIELANVSTDNSTLIGTYYGEEANVTLTGRTLYKDGYWNTICLPFDVKIGGSVLEGAVARTLTSASVIDNETSGQTLHLTFGDAVTDSLKAGVPYIIKWTDGDNITDPVFPGVTISNTYEGFDNGVAGDYRVRFLGTYNKMVYGKDKSVLFMGSNNNLYYPDGEEQVTLGACRAYFKIGENNAVNAKGITGFVIDFGENDEEATGINEAAADSSLFTPHSSLSEWHTVDGIRLNGKPSKKGMYIRNGKTVVVE